MEPLASSLIDDDEVIDFRKKLKQWVKFNFLFWAANISRGK